MKSLNLAQLFDLINEAHKQLPCLKVAAEETVSGIVETDRIVIAEKPYNDHPKDNYLTIVLCYLPDNDSTPFVTWTRNNEPGIVGDSSGHYHKDIVSAAKDFDERGK